MLSRVNSVDLIVFSEYMVGCARFNIRKRLPMTSAFPELEKEHDSKDMTICQSVNGLTFHVIYETKKRS